MTNQYARKMKAALSQSKMKVNIERQMDCMRKKIIPAKYVSKAIFRATNKPHESFGLRKWHREQAATPDPDLKRSLKM